MERTKSKLKVTETPCGKVRIQTESGNDVGSTGTPFVSEMSEGNAAHLVKCWNEHDDLVDTLQSIQEWAESRDGSPLQDEKNLLAIREIAKHALERTKGS